MSDPVEIAHAGLKVVQAKQAPVSYKRRKERCSGRVGCYACRNDHPSPSAFGGNDRKQFCEQRISVDVPAAGQRESSAVLGRNAGENRCGLGSALRALEFLV